MRLGIAAALLVSVASFALAACNEESPGEAPVGPAQQVEVEFDFDTKTKTVTAPPPALPTYRPATPTTKRTTVAPRATTRATKATR